MQQIDSLAEELRQTSLKNVNTGVEDNPPVPKPRKHKARRNSDAGRWRITSFSIDSNNDKSSEFQYSQEKQSSVTHEEHVSKFQEGGFSFQQSSHHANNTAELCQTQSTRPSSHQSLAFQDMVSSGEQMRHLKEQESNIPDAEQNTKKSGRMKYIPNFLSFLPKAKPNNETKRERRSSVACVPSMSSRCSRASSVESQSRSRPIFSYLRDSVSGQEAAIPHRTRQDSALVSRRNSVTSLQKYSSQEYLNQASINNLRVRNNPVLLSGPNVAMGDVQEGFLNKDGSLYQSNEHLNTSAQARSRHRSGSQSRENYCWSGRSQLSGTGLRIGASVTEPEPKDGLALSKDGGFFMPFGNSENLSKKCKTKRQLKAEEQLRKQQEEEEETKRRSERETRRVQRQEKRARNRTMSLSCTNRSNNQMDLSLQRNVNNNINVKSYNANIEKTETCIQLENNVDQKRDSKIITEIENLEILEKVSTINLTENTNTEQKKNTTNAEYTSTHLARQRDAAWQQFGAEYNEYGELISCGKEPVGGHEDSGWVWDGERRDRSGAFWEAGPEYEGLTGGYGGRVGGRFTSGKWDNVRRDPVVHVSQDPDFVPDRSS